VVFCGDLTWGCEPDQTIDLVRDLPAVFVRGTRNGRWSSSPGAPGAGQAARGLDGAQHSPATVEFIAAFPFSVVVDIRGLGPVRFCHGSPRSDTELVTPGTSRSASPNSRPASRSHDRHRHTHLQFDRRSPAAAA
jgi:hypothetical protein